MAFTPGYHGQFEQLIRTWAKRPGWSHRFLGRALLLYGYKLYHRATTEFNYVVASFVRERAAQYDYIHGQRGLGCFWLGVSEGIYRLFSGRGWVGSGVLPPDQAGGHIPQLRNAAKSARGRAGLENLAKFLV